MKTIILILLLSTNLYASSFNAIDMKAIATIESSNNPNAYNKDKKAYGLYQITAPCLADVNKELRRDYALQDMYDPQKAYVVAFTYLHTILPRYIKHYELPEDVSTILLCYNWGIGNVMSFYEGLEHLPKESSEYLMKYYKLMEN